MTILLFLSTIAIVGLFVAYLAWPDKPSDDPSEPTSPDDWCYVCNVALKEETERVDSDGFFYCPACYAKAQTEDSP